MRLALHGPDERPALIAGEPRVWYCEAAVGHPRSTARALLQSILGDGLGMAPRIEFEAGRPPRVDATWQGLVLFLSLSYAGTRALVGVCPGRPIGVDITPVEPVPGMASLARLYLGPAAEATLAAAAESCRAQVFAGLWAELEARGKCLGLGLEEWSPVHAGRLGDPSLRLSSSEWCGHAVAVATLTAARTPCLRSPPAG
ncbi:4'-phosphopantetheinyl transferase superfamily protein [Zoogloea sp.]|uniref:4'-phosphopantetheinyl transferase family protein n=1 Tax=Zoogloea sp. TaxID=49181 RepID=UPI001415AEF5|nr:MAG: 4'-phosphopantetheinyl transferase superfamily protein [Zoogloea sp.]